METFSARVAVPSAGLDLEVVSALLEAFDPVLGRERVGLVTVCLTMYGDSASDAGAGAVAIVGRATALDALECQVIAHAVAASSG